MHKSVWSTSTCFTPTSRCLCDSCWCWKTELPQMFSHWGSCWRWRDAWSGRGRALSCLVRERKRWREKGGGQKRTEKGGEVNQRALPLLMMKLYLLLIALKRNISGQEIQPTDQETKRHGINTPFTLWIFFLLSVCCEFVIQQERRWVKRGEVFNKTVSWHQSKPYSPKTALCLSLALPSALWGCVCVVLLSSSTPMVALSSFLAAQGEIWSRIKGNSEARRYVHTHGFQALQKERRKKQALVTEVQNYLFSEVRPPWTWAACRRSSLWTRCPYAVYHHMGSKKNNIIKGIRHKVQSNQYIIC